MDDFIKYLNVISNRNHKQYKCDECQKAFTKKHNLLRHQRIHKGIKPYLCWLQGCDSRFERKHDMEKHFLLHTGVKIFCCDVDNCKLKFNHSSELKKHQHSHSEIGYFRCPITTCKQRFAKEENLEKHLRFHDTRYSTTQLLELAHGKEGAKGLISELCPKPAKRLKISELCIQDQEEINRSIPVSFNSADRRSALERETVRIVTVPFADFLRKSANKGNVYSYQFINYYSSRPNEQKNFEHPNGVSYNCLVEGCTYQTDNERRIIKHIRYRHPFFTHIQ